MCGRYQLLRPEDIAARFETVNTVPDLVASSDVRPTQSIPVVAMGRELALMQWGITPAWEKDKKKALEALDKAQKLDPSGPIGKQAKEAADDLKKKK